MCVKFHTCWSNLESAQSTSAWAKGPRVSQRSAESGDGSIYSFLKGMNLQKYPLVMPNSLLLNVVIFFVSFLFHLECWFSIVMWLYQVYILYIPDVSMWTEGAEQALTHHLKSLSWGDWLALPFDKKDDLDGLYKVGKWLLCTCGTLRNMI